MGEHVKSRSRITRELPEAVRDDLNRLLLEGATYEQAADWLHEQGYDISQSSVSRYGRQFLQAYQAVRIAEDQARAIKSETGSGLGMEEAVSKMLLQKLMEALMAPSDDIFEHSRIISAFASLQSSSARREKTKADLSERAREIADRVTGKAKAGGLSDEAVEEIRKQILGIV